MAKKKTAWEKMRCGKQPHVERDLPDAFARWAPAGTAKEEWSMLVSTPEEVEQYIAGIPAGRVVTLKQLRADLAARHGVLVTCSMSTAIFVNIVARAYAEREETTGEPGIGWWRVLTGDGKLNPKFPGGTSEQARRLAAEGVAIR